MNNSGFDIAWKYCLIGLTISFTMSGGLAAQISGVVKTGGGSTVSGVAVEAWSEVQRVAAVVSDTNGRFRFLDAFGSDIVLLRASGLGFQVTELRIESSIEEYVLVLTEDPLVIDGLLVTTNQSACEFPQGEVRARNLWGKASQRYHGLMDTLGIASYLAEADTIVAISELGTLELPDLNLNQRGSSSLLRFSWTRRIEREGYAFSTRATDGVEVYESWVYPPLEADFAPHFIDESFGDRHYFRIQEENSDGWSLSFCPKSDKDPSISGSITLARDITVTSVRWSFKTPEPLENAGGSVFFPPVLEDDSDVYLLPSEAITWKSVPGGDYLQRYQRYEGWYVAPGDSVPLLPLRRGP
ncbi:MAG: carboxypeptidase-like regulatory domain-containing protein [bacterium]